MDEGEGGVIRARATIQIMGSTGMLVMVSTRKGAGRRSAHHEHGGSGQWRPPSPSHPIPARPALQADARSLPVAGAGPAPRAHTPPRRRAPVGPPCEPSSPSNTIMRLVRVRPSAERSGAERSRGPEQSTAAPFFRVPAALRPTPTRSSSSSSSCTLNEGRRLEVGVSRPSSSSSIAILRAPHQAHSCGIILPRVVPTFGAGPAP